MIQPRWVLFLAWFSSLVCGCVAGLSEEDLKCHKNSDCVSGYGCNSDKKCVEAGPLALLTESLPTAVKGTDYQVTLVPSGGILPYEWSASFKAGEVELSYFAVDAGGGVIQSAGADGKVPEAAAEQIAVKVALGDSSNAGEGQEVVREYTLTVNECSGDRKDGYQEKDSKCFAVHWDCVEGKLGETVYWDGESTSTDHCGPGCASCDAAVADSCVAGLCQCGNSLPCEGSQNCCDGACVELNTIEHCGSCANVCNAETVKNVKSIQCKELKCEYDECLLGYDCNGIRTDGCEVGITVDNCAGCSDKCDDPSRYVNTTNQSCTGGKCAYDCGAGYADCVPDDLGAPASLGCETSVKEDGNCGGCGVSCAQNPSGKECREITTGVFGCGCDDVAADCLSAEDLCCENVCAPRGQKNCTECGVGCSILAGGPDCNPGGGVGEYGCGCSVSEDCKGQYGFSLAECSGGFKCHCQGELNCEGTVNNICCNIDEFNKGCVDLATDRNNCGMCGVVCGAAPSKDPEQCVNGACTCVNTWCPTKDGGLGAPDCVNLTCVCAYYGNKPCPVGQYCCEYDGCCLYNCNTEQNNCSDDCLKAGDIWCPWGCCTECAGPEECDQFTP